MSTIAVKIICEDIEEVVKSFVVVDNNVKFVTEGVICFLDVVAGVVVGLIEVEVAVGLVDVHIAIAIVVVSFTVINVFVVSSSKASSSVDGRTLLVGDR